MFIYTNIKRPTSFTYIKFVAEITGGFVNDKTVITTILIGKDITKFAVFMLNFFSVVEALTKLFYLVSKLLKQETIIIQRK